MSRWLIQLRLLLRALFRGRQVEQDLDQELQYHLECQIEEGLTRGMAPEEARCAALRAMGAITQNKEECRDVRRVNWIVDLMHDLRHGARSVRKNPAFTVVVMLVLASVIAAIT